MMSPLLARLLHLDIDDDERRYIVDGIIALEIEITLLRASLNAHRAERDRLLQQVGEALAMTRRTIKAIQ